MTRGRPVPAANHGGEPPFHLPVMAVIGVGMIGGSLSLGLKKRRLVDRVIGYGRNQENLERAMEVGAIDEIAVSAKAAVSDADVIILATPVGVMGEIMGDILPQLRGDAVITDVGSVKQGVVTQARENLGDLVRRFVPAHPVAGKERSGVSAASADLYERHRVAITPLAESDPDAVATVTAMWRAVGSDVVEMEVAEHDRVLAMTSHLPHLLAYAMVHYFAAGEDREKCYEMVGGGFYDFTRIASSDPVMWRDICLMNDEAILNHVRGFRETLDAIESMVENGHSQDLEALFSSAREARAVVTERRRITPTEEQVSTRRRVRQLVNR